MKTLMSIKNLQKYFPVKKQNLLQVKKEYVKANKDISVDIIEGETLGIVGESGCGKSTFGRTIIQLQRQTGGSTLYYGDTIENFMPSYVRKVYQDLAKTSKYYDRDFNELQEIKAQIEGLSGEAKKDMYEKLRLKQIDFDNTYGNVIRLVGGLLAHEDLNKTSRILIERYEAASEVARYKRELEFEKQRQEMKASVDESKIKELQHELDETNVRFEEVNVRLKAFKAEIKGSEKYEKFEKQRDDGIDLAALTKKESRFLRKDLQIIFQDPYSSLDPRLTVGDIIGEGLLVHQFFRSKRDKGYTPYILDIMEKCGLDPEYIHRYPHQFSGGQRQRIGIARALALKPKFIVCDEAVSALDVSIQSQIINLLQDLRDQHNLTYLFITHDLGVVRYISNRIGVMYFGHLVELAPAEAIFSNPQHPYTKQLLNAIPTMDDDAVQWDARLEFDDFVFNYANKGQRDSDWIEVGDQHFVACTLKNRDEFYARRGVNV